jgi:hypothetical protein
MTSISKKLVLSALVLGFAGCRTFTPTFSTESVAPPEPIRIDGKADDWRGNLFVEGQRLEIGFLNDRENLYVCLRTRDNVTRADILTQGLTVWFDPSGGTKTLFGIKFPVGLPPSEQKLTSRETRENAELEKLSDKMPLTEMEILRGKEPPQKLTVAEAKGIEVKVVPTYEEIVYELKIPLAATEQHPFAIGTEPGKTIGVGFDSPRLETSEMHGKRSEHRPPQGDEGGEEGGDEGRGGGERGEEGRGGYGRESPMQGALKIWAFVHLTQD